MKDTKIGILNRQIWRLVLEARPYLVLVHSFINFWGKAKLEAKRLDGLEALFQVGGGKLPGERLGDFLVVVLKS